METQLSASALPPGWGRFFEKENSDVGSSNKEIAHVLGLSEGTIKVHLHRIYQRIGVSNRTQWLSSHLRPSRLLLKNL
jgi:hypothetical protein